MKDVCPGDVLHDMHDPLYQEFFRDYDGRMWDIDRISWQVVQTSCGSKVIEEAVEEECGSPYRYTNKMLVVIKSDEQETQVAYSYDGRRMGIFTIRLVR